MIGPEVVSTVESETTNVSIQLDFQNMNDQLPTQIERFGTTTRLGGSTSDSTALEGDRRT